jgi:hypothetical protein
MRNDKIAKGIAAGALLVAGLGVGTAVLGGTAANAATGDSKSTTVASTDTASTDASTTQAAPDPTQPVRSDEQLLTGDTADKVRDLALAEYPGATVQRVETDSEGVYEAHIVTAAGEQVIVQVGADFTVTGTQTGGPGGPGGTGAPPTDGNAPGAPDGSAPAAPAASAATPGTAA